MTRPGPGWRWRLRARAWPPSEGVHPRRADALAEMGVRHVLVESALQDLNSSSTDVLGAAPAAALEAACRTLAATAGPYADALANATAQEAAAAGVATFMQMQARELHRQAREAAEKAARMAGAAAAAAGMGADPFANIAGAPPVVPGLEDTLSSLPQLEAFNGPVVEAETLARVIRCVEAVIQKTVALRQPALLPPPLLKTSVDDGDEIAGGFRADLPDMRTPSAACSAPLYGRLAKSNEDIEALAGAEQAPPIVRPVELTLVPDSVATVEEASGAMRKAVHCCVLLANQAELLPNTFQLRASLLTHLFCSVLPAPLPLTHPRRRSECFWASQTVRYETQAELLRCLRLLLLQFGAAALSMTATRSFDAARLLTLASFATTADAILRLRVNDHPSPFCLHYSGDADGPVAPFGFEMGPFGVEAEYLRFHCPERTGRLTQVLDYFHGIKDAVTDDHMVFRWEKSADFGAGTRDFCRRCACRWAFRWIPTNSRSTCPARAGSSVTTTPRCR